MTSRISLSHQTTYEFDRPVRASNHLIRLRPAPHTRIPIAAYSMSIMPQRCSIGWQQDPFGNYVAHVQFPEKLEKLIIKVDLIADLAALNPFDFVLDPSVRFFPFFYEERLRKDLYPYLQLNPCGPLFSRWLADIKLPRLPLLEALSMLNKTVNDAIAYSIRLEPGIQSCDETLQQKRGSCRDMAFLLLQTLRHLGFAARFASGYLVQLNYGASPKTNTDLIDLHAWVEVYLPGAGWIGLDPTSGYFTSECHIPLSCTPEPESAAPVVGFTDKCSSALHVSMNMQRLEMHGPLTLMHHYNDHTWEAITAVALKVDRSLHLHDVRLTMGGEPTFIAQENTDAPEWSYEANGEEKFIRANALLRRIAQRRAPGALLYSGLGKYYPQEALPRFILSCYELKDGTALWKNPHLLADPSSIGTNTFLMLQKFAQTLHRELKLPANTKLAAFEDRLLKNILDGQTRTQPLHEEPVGFVIPLSFAKEGTLTGEHWRHPGEKLYLLSGTLPIGMRLPLRHIEKILPDDSVSKDLPTALTLELNNGNILVFLPPVLELSHYRFLLGALEQAASKSNCAVVIGGYAPPDHVSLKKTHLTPDPGVLEVNLEPAANWPDLERSINEIYEEAKASRLTAERYLLDGRQIGTGGGSHITIGGATLADSPFMRRPDLLQSFISFAQHHPSLSYLFCGLFVGATSQAPRPDETRHERLYELEIAFKTLEQNPHQGHWLLERLFGNLLTDSLGSRHRSEICIDKLYAPHGGSGRQGIVEFRSFEMMPHPHMCLLQMLLIRALVAFFWQRPYKHPLVRWGSELHDKFMLPYFLWNDLGEALNDLTHFGYEFSPQWFLPFLEQRFPSYGKTRIEGMDFELRMALEPWHVISEDTSFSSGSRMVDNSTERVQLLIKNLTQNRYVITCNQRRIPLHRTKTEGHYIAGIRFKARNPLYAIHPYLPVNTPLVFDVYDSWHRRSVGGFTYYSEPPNGIPHQKSPINAMEAESRVASRFVPHGYNASMSPPKHEAINNEYPYTLDLRRL